MGHATGFLGGEPEPLAGGHCPTGGRSLLLLVAELWGDRDGHVFPGACSAVTGETPQDVGTWICKYNSVAQPPSGGVSGVLQPGDQGEFAPVRVSSHTLT